MPGIRKFLVFRKFIVYNIIIIRSLCSVFHIDWTCFKRPLVLWDHCMISRKCSFTNRFYFYTITVPLKETVFSSKPPVLSLLLLSLCFHQVFSMNDLFIRLFVIFWFPPFIFIFRCKRDNSMLARRSNIRWNDTTVLLCKKQLFTLYDSWCAEDPFESLSNHKPFR